MQLRESKEHSYFGPRKNPQIKITAQDVKSCLADLGLLGIGLDEQMILEMAEQQGHAKRMGVVGLDSLPATLTQGSVGTPIQFLQNWLPGFVYTATAARKIDQLIGMSITGSWEDAEVVQGEIELTGTAIPYGDQVNTTFNNWNTNFVRRSNVRFMAGMRVGVLEEATASRMRVNSADAKRESSTLSLEISRNYTGFYGFNSGDNLTYGFLNDPGLPAYTNAPNGLWATATFLEIQQDVLTMINDVRTKSQDTIDVGKTPMTLALATNIRDFLSVTSDFGISVMDWMNKAYPNIRVESAPELNEANSSQNVAYLYAERVEDQSTDGGAVWVQPITAKMRLIGVQKLDNGYQERYSNGTAGAICKRPWALVRYTGF